MDTVLRIRECRVWYVGVKIAGQANYYRSPQDPLNNRYYNGRQSTYAVVLDGILSQEESSEACQVESAKEFVNVLSAPECRTVATSLRQKNDAAIVCMLGMIWDIDVEGMGRDRKRELAVFLKTEPTMGALFGHFPEYKELWVDHVVPLWDMLPKEESIIYSSGHKGFRIIVGQDLYFGVRMQDISNAGKTLVLPALQTRFGEKVSCIDPGIWGSSKDIRPNLQPHPVTRLWPALLDMERPIDNQKYGHVARHAETLYRIKIRWYHIMLNLPEQIRCLSKVQTVSQNRTRKRDEALNALRQNSHVTKRSRPIQSIETMLSYSAPEGRLERACFQLLQERGHSNITFSRKDDNTVYVGVGKNGVDRFCPAVKRSHSSNNQGFIIAEDEGSISQFGHKSGCGGSTVIHRAQSTLFDRKEVGVSATTVRPLVEEKGSVTTAKPIEVIPESIAAIAAQPPNVQPTDMTCNGDIKSRLDDSPFYRQYSRDVKFCDEQCAKIVMKHVGADLVCVDTRKGKWYYFDGNLWREDFNENTIWDRIGDVLVVAKVWDFLHAILDARHQAVLGVDKDRIRDLDELEKETKKMIQYAASKYGRTNIIYFCRHSALNTEFEARLDANVDLLGFTNGVLDLKTGVFGPGTPEHMVSLSTNYDYLDLTLAEIENDANFRQLYAQLHTAIPEPERWEYLLRLSASMLEGLNRLELFHVWTGCGSNGKSTMLRFLKVLLGDYASPGPMEMLTTFADKPDTANATILNLRKRRMIFFVETRLGQQLLADIVKNISGNDLMSARYLHSNEIHQFYAHFTPILACNELPGLPVSTNATLSLSRRLRILDWNVKFFQASDEDYDCRDSRHHLKNSQIDLDIERGITHFMSYLVKKYLPMVQQDNSIRAPSTVITRSKTYVAQQCIVQQWWDADMVNLILRSDTESVKFKDLWELFNDYCQRHKIPRRKQPARKEVNIFVAKQLGPMALHRRLMIYKGWQLLID